MDADLALGRWVGIISCQFIQTIKVQIGRYFVQDGIINAGHSNGRPVSLSFRLEFITNKKLTLANCQTTQQQLDNDKSNMQ